jgi:glycosyltransferase involved in cell wall biosynthesis
MKIIHVNGNEIKAPLISICIPTYNGGKFIEETLNCAINQSYPNIEIIIADDNSSDKTIDICNLFALKDHRIKIFKNEKNLGLVGNWCEVINKTSINSVWIKFLFQDDLMDRTTVEKMYNSSQSSNVDFVLTNRSYFFENDVAKKTVDAYGLVKKTNEIFSESKKYTPNETSRLITPYIFHNCLGEPPCTFFKKSTFLASDFHEDMPQLVDYIFSLDKILSNDFYFLNEKLIKFRVHNNSQTSSNTASNSNSKKINLKLVQVRFYERLKICFLLLNRANFELIKDNIGINNIRTISNFIFYRSLYKNKSNFKELISFYQTTNIKDFILKNKRFSFISLRYKLSKFTLNLTRLKSTYDL